LEDKNLNRFENNAERIAYLEDKHEEMKINKEKDLILDFDKALEEEKNSSSKIKIKLIGKYYDLPRDIPFNFSTFLLRNCYKRVGGKTIMFIPDDKVFQFLELMFGKNFIMDIEKSKNRDISITFIFDNIVPEIMKQWGQQVDFKSQAAQGYQKKISIQG
jgi:hypothetical protein